MGNIFAQIAYLLSLHQDGFTQSQLSQFNFNFENDFLFQTDEYYNHSTKLEWIFKNKKIGYLYNINLKQEMYTPSDHKKGYLNYSDMPYTSSLNFEFGIHKYTQQEMLSFDVGMGYSGKYTYAKESMEIIHSLLPTKPIYLGWDTQKSTTILTRVSFMYKYKKNLKKNKIDTILNYGISAANLRSRISCGGEIRYALDNLANDFGTYSVYSNKLNYKDTDTKSYFYLFLGTSYNYVFNDMTLRGLEIYHNQLSIYGGFTYKINDFNIGIVLNKETKRFTKQKNDNYGYANIFLGWSY